MESNLERYFALARERNMMRHRREHGEPPPWSDDLILSTYRFCNVHRAHDRVSTWLIDNIYRPLGDQPSVFMAAYVARWINKIETLELLREEILGDFDLEKMRSILAPHKALGTPLFGAAYIIQSPTGLNKVDGILWAIGNVTKRWHEGYKIAIETRSMERVHEWLMQFPHMGPFMAYQVVCDLTYTPILENAVDRQTWTCAGPGAARGLGWLVADDSARFNYNAARDQEEMKRVMQDVLQSSSRPELWPAEWAPWELATVQHWSCEYDKYRRALTGERLKRRFSPCK